MSQEQDPTSLEELLARLQVEAVNTKATGSPLSPRNLVAGRFGVEDDGDDLGDDEDNDPVDDIEDDDLDAGTIARRLAVARQMAQGQGPQAPFVRNPSSQVVPTSQVHDSEFVFARSARQARDFALHFGPQALIAVNALAKKYPQIISYLSHFAIIPSLYTGETQFATTPLAMLAGIVGASAVVTSWKGAREWGEDIATVVENEKAQVIAKYLGKVSLVMLYLGIADRDNQLGLLSAEKPFIDVQFHLRNYLVNLLSGISQNYSWLLEKMPDVINEKIGSSFSFDAAGWTLLAFGVIKNRKALVKLANLTASGATKLAKQAQNRRR